MWGGSIGRSLMLSVGTGLVGLLAAGASGASAAPLYPQCPPIGNNGGCSQLIVVAHDGTVTVTTDPAAPPLGYDGSDDTLIGIQNNSKGPISSINLASPSADLFGFDSDGICNPDQWPSAPPTTPPGCPGPQGFGPTGYEGPNGTFSNISSNFLTGTVNFTTPLAPGASTYWALEEALTAGQVQGGAGGHPITTAATVVGPVVNFSLTCVGTASCIGVAELTVIEKLKGNKITQVTAARKHKRKAPTRRVIVGSVHFTAAGGETVPISVTLNRKGQGLRSSHGAFPAGLSVALTQPVGPPQVTNVAKVRFLGTKKPRKHRKHH
jgi:hypothetical protein